MVLIMMAVMMVMMTTIKITMMMTMMAMITITMMMTMMKMRAWVRILLTEWAVMVWLAK